MIKLAPAAQAERQGPIPLRPTDAVANTLYNPARVCIMAQREGEGEGGRERERGREREGGGREGGRKRERDTHTHTQRQTRWSRAVLVQASPSVPVVVVHLGETCTSCCNTDDGAAVSKLLDFWCSNSQKNQSVFFTHHLNSRANYETPGSAQDRHKVEQLLLVVGSRGLVPRRCVHGEVVLAPKSRQNGCPITRIS